MFVYSLVSFSLLSVSQFCFLLLLFFPQRNCQFSCAHARMCVCLCVCLEEDNYGEGNYDIPSFYSPFPCGVF